MTIEMLTRNTRPLLLRQATDHAGPNAPTADSLPEPATAITPAGGVVADGAHRFWPYEIDLRAGGGPARPSRLDQPTRMIGSAIDAHLDGLSHVPAVTSFPAPRTLGPRSTRTRNRPSWSRFEPSIERVPPTYLAFGSLEHLTGYLRVRATLTTGTTTG